MTTDAAAQPQPPRTSDPPPPMPPSSLHAAAAAAAHEQPDPLPENVREYADIKYWDARFEREEQYDWLRSFDAFRHLVERDVRRSDRILVLGTGSSSLPADLVAAGYADVVATDLSPVVERMRRRTDGLRGAVRWAVADMLDLREFEDASFDCVIEKGTYDVLLVDAPSRWDPPLAARARMRAALSEAHRVLRPHGVLLSITWDGPHFRRSLLLDGAFTWRVRCETFGEGEGWYYYCYTLRKGLKSADDTDDDATAVRGEQQHAGPSMLHEELDDEAHILRVGLGGSSSDDDDVDGGERAVMQGGSNTAPGT